MNNFNSNTKYNYNKDLMLKEKVLNSIIRTKYIENNENICQLLFNNKDLSNTNFDQFSYIISPSFVHILIKFNDIKEKDYFRKLMKKIFSKFTLNNLNNTFDNFNEKIYTNYESVLYFLEIILDNFDDLNLGCPEKMDGSMMRVDRLFITALIVQNRKPAIQSLP